MMINVVVVVTVVVVVVAVVVVVVMVCARGVWGDSVCVGWGACLWCKIDL